MLRVRHPNLPARPPARTQVDTMATAKSKGTKRERRSKAGERKDARQARSEKPGGTPGARPARKGKKADELDL
jgi:hypothetical protein